MKYALILIVSILIIGVGVTKHSKSTSKVSSNQPNPTEIGMNTNTTAWLSNKLNAATFIKYDSHELLDQPLESIELEFIASISVGCEDIFDVTIASQSPPFTIKFDQLDKKSGSARMNGNKGSARVAYVNKPPSPLRDSQLQFIEEIPSGAMSVTSVFPMKYGDGYRYVAVYYKIMTITPLFSNKVEVTLIDTWIGSAKLNPSKSPKSREEILAGLRSKDTPEAMFQLGLFLADKGVSHRETYLSLWRSAAERGHIPAGYLWESQTTNSNGKWTKEFLHLVAKEDPKALAVSAREALKMFWKSEPSSDDPLFYTQTFPSPKITETNRLSLIKKFELPLEYLQKAIKAKEPLAQFTLGQIVAHGNLFVQEKVGARQLLEEVAIQDVDSYSQLKSIELLVPLCESLGDRASAIPWAERSLSSDNWLLAHYLGNAYLYGDGIKRDTAKAQHYYSIAADLGSHKAQCAIGMLYRGMYGHKSDPVEMIRWFSMAANNGSIAALTELAYCFRDGTGVPPDKKQALDYFQRAAEKGDKNAQYELGNHYLDGVGVLQDPTEAVRWFTKAAMQGDPHAMAQLGLACATGKGVQRDLVQASALWNLAAARGEETSRRNRKIVEDQLNDAQKQRAAQLAKEIENRINSEEVPLGPLNEVAPVTLVEVRPISLTPRRSFTGLTDVSLILELSNKADLPLSLAEIGVVVQSGTTTVKDTCQINFTVPVEPTETRRLECTFGSDSQLAKAQLSPTSKVTLKVQQIFTPKREH